MTGSQTKPEFIDGVMIRKAIVKLITFPDLKLAVIGDAAMHAISINPTDGKANGVKNRGP